MVAHTSVKHMGYIDVTTAFSEAFALDAMTSTIRIVVLGTTLLVFGSPSVHCREIRGRPSSTSFCNWRPSARW